MCIGVLTFACGAALHFPAIADLSDIARILLPTICHVPGCTLLLSYGRPPPVPCGRCANCTSSTPPTPGPASSWTRFPTSPSECDGGTPPCFDLAAWTGLHGRDGREGVSYYLVRKRTVPRWMADVGEEGRKGKNEVRLAMLGIEGPILAGGWGDEGDWKMVFLREGLPDREKQVERADVLGELRKRREEWVRLRARARAQVWREEKRLGEQEMWFVGEEMWVEGMTSGTGGGGRRLKCGMSGEGR